MGILEKDLGPFHGNLICFLGEQVGIRGYINLLTLLGTAPLAKAITIRYLVVDYQAPYNALLALAAKQQASITRARGTMYIWSN